MQPSHGSTTIGHYPCMCGPSTCIEPLLGGVIRILKSNAELGKHNYRECLVKKETVACVLAGTNMKHVHYVYH